MPLALPFTPVCVPHVRPGCGVRRAAPLRCGRAGAGRRGEAGAGGSGGSGCRAAAASGAPHGAPTGETASVCAGRGGGRWRAGCAAARPGRKQRVFLACSCLQVCCHARACLCLHLAGMQKHGNGPTIAAYPASLMRILPAHACMPAPCRRCSSAWRVAQADLLCACVLHPHLPMPVCLLL